MALYRRRKRVVKITYIKGAGKLAPLNLSEELMHSTERYCNKCRCRCHCYADICPSCVNDICETCDCKRVANYQDSEND